MIRTLVLTTCLCVIASNAVAAPLKPLKVRVDRLQREALVHIPAGAAAEKLPVVFVFHGHGGTAPKAAENFAVHEHWPEALCVYMQGVPTPSAVDPQGLKPGWQKGEGDYGDRDLQFFDATLARLKQQHKVDKQRIYAAGFSNGASFTFLLWAVRGDVLAAVSTNAAPAGPHLKQLTPKPCLHIAGENDNTVAFETQQKTMDNLRKRNGCEDSGQPWNNGKAATATLYPSPTGTPFVSVVHSGGHEVPVFAGRMMTRFFKGHAKPEQP